MGKMSNGIVGAAPDNEQRFLREIALRVPMSRLVELHLFAPLSQGGVESGVALMAVVPLQEVEADVAATVDRLVVYTASYRHVQRGVDRGKWEFTMNADADAPLPVLDRVVDGVVHRSGAQGEAVRLSPAEIMARIGEGSWTTTS
jgi:hypothetical protein